MNQQYDQLQTLADEESLDWVGDRIVAVLGTSGTFTASDKLLSETGLHVVKTEEVRGRYVRGDVQLCGLDVLFTSLQASQYQLILAKDIGNGDPYVLGWFDEDFNGDPLGLAHSGSFIVRATFTTGDPEYVPDVGVWLTLQEE